jgi:hypothetical protein
MDERLVRKCPLWIHLRRDSTPSYGTCPDYALEVANRHAVTEFIQTTAPDATSGLPHFD